MKTMLTRVGSHQREGKGSIYPLPLILFQPPSGQLGPGMPHSVLHGTRNSLAWRAAGVLWCNRTWAAAF